MWTAYKMGMVMVMVWTHGLVHESSPSTLKGVGHDHGRETNVILWDVLSFVIINSRNW